MTDEIGRRSFLLSAGSLAAVPLLGSAATAFARSAPPSGTRSIASNLTPRLS